MATIERRKVITGEDLLKIRETTRSSGLKLTVKTEDEMIIQLLKMSLGELHHSSVLFYLDGKEVLFYRWINSSDGAIGSWVDSTALVDPYCYLCYGSVIMGGAKIGRGAHIAGGNIVRKGEVISNAALSSWGTLTEPD